ncbi:MAG TPA: class I SAM-dependent methyltransferase [Acidimicrobiia bacterium]
MTDSDADIDVRSYFEPEDIVALASFEAGHYWHVARRKVILDALPDVGGEARLLDIGCGPGTTTTFFNRHHHTVDYADVHPEGLTLARALATQELGAQAASRLRFLQLDICRDPVPGGYAGVLLLDVIEHLPDDVAALRNVRSGLTPGDHLVVTVPAFPCLWSRFDEHVRHKRRYTVKTARTAIEAAGFDVEHATYFFSPLFIAAGAVKLGREIRKKAPVRWRAHDESLEGLMEARTSPILTKILVRVLDLERPIVRRGRLPFGTSVLCVARAR